jgi:transposase
LGATIPAGILGYQGQVIEEVLTDHDAGMVHITCRRDARRRPVDPKTGRCGGINRFKRRTISDVPLAGYACAVEIEYAEVYLSPSHVRVEQLEFVLPKARVTRRFGRLISGLCRHLPISVVARHTGLRWDAIKAIDSAHLAEIIEPVRPQDLMGIRYLGVDEVARAKGQDYFTLVYDLTPGENCGRILWVHEGKDGAALCKFLDALSESCAKGIEAIAMDMGPAYISAVQTSLPSAAIVFDRFHVMQLFSKVIRDCRSAEFKEAKKLGDLTGQEIIKGSLYLLLANRDNLKDTDRSRLERLLSQNQKLNTLYTLKEQLQQLWNTSSSPKKMAASLEDWCGMAEKAAITGLAQFVKTLRAHRTGISNYAAHPITTAKLEAGNVAIGLLRRRARGFRDMEYFKLKIFQLNTEDTPSFLFTKFSTLSSV